MYITGASSCSGDRSQTRHCERRAKTQGARKSWPQQCSRQSPPPVCPACPCVLRSCSTSLPAWPSTCRRSAPHRLPVLHLRGSGSCQQGPAATAARKPSPSTGLSALYPRVTTLHPGLPLVHGKGPAGKPQGLTQGKEPAGLRSVPRASFNSLTVGNSERGEQNHA